MVEFAIVGYPIYQLKLQNVSKSGFGAIVRPDSKLLALIQIDQRLRVKLVAYRGASDLVPWAYRVRIAHISESRGGRFNRHMVVGAELLEKLSE